MPEVEPGLPKLVHVPEMIPSPIWGISGFRLLPTATWRAIRAQEVDRAGGACEVCGRAQSKGLICHEVWDHRIGEGQGIATLAALRMQCRPCDEVTHYGLAESRGRGARARARLAQLNGMGPEMASAVIEVMYERHATLSSVRRWTVRIAPSLAERHPDLRAIEQVVEG
ncbi:hypothetical protein DVS28_a2993 [Euzebya pacifica]|uniref:HNH endonuclease n=1 Tax=Euzebya pacifica TaxID=1608957 RepID=A0A346XZM5_9ACTN|nr:hypothetical protein [Euzebya pacifica]AXV07672.1 hypothetical protein DVS28_a2993 [Euzebya pacifica]